MDVPVLYVVIPCFNEQEVLSLSVPIFAAELDGMIEDGRISRRSRILFVDDGSKDDTWKIISEFAEHDERICGISLSCNRGQQNALLAGLTEAADKCDIALTIDCDGQDDPGVIRRMVEEYCGGCDIVYGVRSDRSRDRFSKRFTAQTFYKILGLMGVQSVYNHADCRLLSRRAVKALLEYRETELYLRGIIPLIGFRSTVVEYERMERMAGKTCYSFGKMFALAVNAVTGLSIKPLRIISALGFIVSLMSAVGILWTLIQHFSGNTVSGWSSTVCIICFVSGIQLLSLGVIGEYIGKIYLEVKSRPRFFISDRTDEKD